MYILKLLVVLACYALSSAGVFYALVRAMHVTTFSGRWQILLLLWFAAAFAHVHLSLAWIEGRTLGKKTSCIAVMLGFLGLTAYPAILYLSGRGSLDLQLFLSFARAELLLVIPAFLLAVYLTWFHARSLSLRRPTASAERVTNEA